MTLAVLAPYRRRDVGSTMLESVLDAVAKTYSNVASIYLHVQTNNASAIKFYEKFGFVVKETLKGYYKRIDPSDCFVLEKTLERATEKEEQ